MPKHDKSYALSGTNIINFLRGRTKLITYDELSQFRTIDELLHPYGNAVILYQEEKNNGHWVAVLKHPNRIEHFDSYSTIPDGEFKWIKNKKVNYKTKTPYLTQLLVESPYKIEYNHKQLQKDGSSIATCGRHVLVRILLKDLDIDTYLKVMNYFPDVDELVYELTKNI